MAPTTIVVRRGPRGWGPLIAGLGGVFLILAVPVLFGLARNASLGDARRLESQIEQSRSEADRIARQLRDLEAANEQLRQELTDLKKGREIDRQASTEVQKALAAEQQEVTSLREQLAFYRGVMSPQALQSGLHVNELRVSLSAPDVFHYELVLVQAARQDRRATGRIEMRLIGRDRAVQRSLTTADLGATAPVQFSFRHFQEFSGDLRLPVGFKPEKVVVTLLPDGGGSPQVQQEFEWSRIQAGAG